MKLSLLLIGFFLVSCATKINNYVTDEKGNRMRNGLWIEESSADSGTLQEKGKYKNGEKTGLWITSFKGKIKQKERFRKNFSKIKIYHDNEVLKQKGRTATEITNDYRHCFYQGELKFYDKKGKHIYSKIYEKGNKVDSVVVNKR